ncbi:MAG: class I SAM-dependent methyltransferase [Roseiarcus sp.]|jgi:phosphatidylethanolamine/phosphatidyl-N-methylethanolamine N-methyltransferase
MINSGAARARPSAGALTEAAYNRWAPFYDLIFDLPFHPGRLAAARAAAAAAAADGSVLVVGVGTGLELGLLPKSLRVTGIDLSPAMLKIARERIARHALGQVKALHVMDAGALEFPDCQFDVALAPYVISVVPSPARVLDEMWRVVRPGGQLIVMNHFAATRGARAAAEAAMQRYADWLGWHPQFPYAAVGDWIAGRRDVELLERRALAPFRLFTLLRIRKAAGAA